MFVHLVLFKIKRRDVPTYVRDCRLWAKEASKHAGFLGTHTLFRTNQKDEYASLYMWQNESAHKRFMKKHHDRLVSLSHCPVRVLGYYNFTTQPPKG